MTLVLVLRIHICHKNCDVNSGHCAVGILQKCCIATFCLDHVKKTVDGNIKTVWEEYVHSPGTSAHTVLDLSLDVLCSCEVDHLLICLKMCKNVS